MAMISVNLNGTVVDLDVDNLEEMIADAFERSDFVLVLDLATLRKSHASTFESRLRGLEMQAAALDAMGAHSAEVEVLKRVEDFIKSGDEQHLADKMRLLFNRAITEFQLGHSDVAEQLYRTIIDDTAQHSEASIAERRAKGLFNLAVLLADIDRPEEAEVEYRRLINEYQESTDAAVQEQVGRAYVNLGNLISKTATSGDSIPIYDEFIEKFGGSSSKRVQDNVLAARLNKAVRLISESKAQEATSILDDIIPQLELSDEESLRRQLAFALFNRALARERLRDYQGSKGDLRLLISTFATSEDRRVIEAVEDGTALLKQLLPKGNPDTKTEVELRGLSAGSK